MTKHERNLLTPQEIEHERTRLRKRREWVERKAAHWTRMGTPSEVKGGAAVPKWRSDAVEEAKKKRLEMQRRGLAVRVVRTVT